MPPIAFTGEYDQVFSLIQEIGTGFRLSLDAVIYEPLPERMVALLRQLALAETERENALTKGTQHREA